MPAKCIGSIVVIIIDSIAIIIAVIVIGSIAIIITVIVIGSIAIIIAVIVIGSITIIIFFQFAPSGNTAQKMKFFIEDFFRKCEQIFSFLRIWSHLLKKSLMKKLCFFCSGYYA